jgi:hypothetical protein
MGFPFSAKPRNDQSPAKLISLSCRRKAKRPIDAAVRECDAVV